MRAEGWGISAAGTEHVFALIVAGPDGGGAELEGQLRELRAAGQGVGDVCVGSLDGGGGVDGEAGE